LQEEPACNVNWRFEETNYLHSSTSDEGLGFVLQRYGRALSVTCINNIGWPRRFGWLFKGHVSSGGVSERKPVVRMLRNENVGEQEICNPSTQFTVDLLGLTWYITPVRVPQHVDLFQ